MHLIRLSSRQLTIGGLGYQIHDLFFIVSECELHTSLQVEDNEILLLTSPNFPNDYSNSLKCVWYFVAADNDVAGGPDHFTISIQHFDLEDGYDVVSFGAGGSNTTQEDNGAGLNLGDYIDILPILIGGDYMWIRFTSDGYHDARRGFFLEIGRTGTKITCNHNS